ncbi:TPA_exp: putative MFS drug efflux transporter [Trichophyton benhamiae CBS 112371]|uniref:MFS drug efflux transporter, putative n=2 Tax=Trichophyton TaxID=5550 RepID=D4B614_ARTBC|nr:MFS drug efflux transporter, putative [Trichophyton benhamiae CBS 112371]XP_003023303.1 MFS drug efflux transporter, putative [Trichophyton verrucosum HKI 0517]EFE29227.1 MFS drug efflux transporter, putative [Trichophyton benhamiae CBS 112371]EFE42685.1 MFS drug efflux transporter, putative [Trichophyton verrucosum HKI 0517]DAA72516.1 TPA_exp: putative MFS drug efflux transporter [Trichophyton benhamiae CBS 112371]
MVLKPDTTTSKGLDDTEKGACSCSDTHQADERSSPRDIHGTLWLIVVLGIFSSTFLFGLDNTIVANIQPAIVKSLNGVEKLAWSGVAFIMASSATVLTWLQIFNQFNIKWMYIFSITVFLAGSAVCGAAQTMDILIGGRVICGIGGVGQYVGVMNFLPRLTSLQERPIYVSAIGLTWGAGTVLGPIIGGAFADSSAGWRWSFYINLVVGGLCMPVYLFLLPSLQPQPDSKIRVMDKLKKLDIVGSLILVGAFVAGVIGLNFAGALYPWNAPGIIAALVLGAVGFIVFGIQQSYCIFTTEETRLFPVELVSWCKPVLSLIFLCGCCTSVCVTIPAYIIPLYFQFTAGDKSLESGVRLLPFVCLLVFSCVGGGILASRAGYYLPWYLAGGALCLVGSALMYTVNPGTAPGAIYGFSALIGLGSGMYLQLGHSVAQAKASLDKIPAAIAFTTTAQLNGMTIALVIAQCVFVNKAATGIAKVLPHESHSTIIDAITGTGSTFVHDLDPHTKAAVLAAIVSAIDKTYILCIVAGAATVLSTFGMKWERLFISAVAA